VTGWLDFDSPSTKVEPLYTFASCLVVFIPAAFSVGLGEIEIDGGHRAVFALQIKGRLCTLWRCGGGRAFETFQASIPGAVNQEKSRHNANRSTEHHVE
jgi:hypothetical protein